MIEIQLLGPVEGTRAGSPLDLGPPRQRAVLAALAADVGRHVSTDTLIERVWGLEPPDKARSTLQVYIARLRGVLGQADSGEPMLLRRSGGYLLDVDPQRVDTHLFRGLLEQSRDPHCPDTKRSGLLADALALWRGKPLSTLDGEWPDRFRHLLVHLRQEAIVDWAEAQMRMGRTPAVIGQLGDALAEDPLAEPLAMLLMRALHDTGRGAEALACYDSLRHRLATQLGIDPGAELQQLHRAILRRERAETRARPALPGPAEPSPHPCPAQLPADVRGFVGRDTELSNLDSLLDDAGSEPATAVISALWGIAGVGKTALAVHWAHGVTHRFPGGQLYVNLGGFGPTSGLLSPAVVLRAFIEALQGAGKRVPSGLEAQIGLYRSLLSGRRVLVVLDNARDADQVRPLLPGTPGCCALVTSRDRLSGLVVREGAHHLGLDPLTPGEARDLLAVRLGDATVAREPRAVEGIIHAGTGLPLALAIFAARAAAHPALPLAALAEELTEARTRLHPVQATDPAANLRIAFSWSYRALDSGGARLFRRLGLHPTPELGLAPAAALIHAELAQARSLLDNLVQISLLTSPEPGRYRMHDLLHAYAGELAEATDAPQDRAAAVRRLIDHYLITARAGSDMLDPQRDLPPAPEPAGAIGGEPIHGKPIHGKPIHGKPIHGKPEALAWFDRQRSALIAAVGIAAGRNDLQHHAWSLAMAMETFLQRQGHWADMVRVETAALDAATSAEDLVGQAHAQRGLGRAYGRSGRFDDAVPPLRIALGLFTDLGDTLGQAVTCVDLGWVMEQTGDRPAALAMASQALMLYRCAGHLAGQARALNGVGWFHAQLGDPRAGLAECERALALFRDLGDDSGEAATWDSIGFIHHRLGEPARALDNYERALVLRRNMGDRDGEADSLQRVGDVHRDIGNREAAMAAWHQALSYLEEYGDPAVAQVRDKLAAMASHNGSGRQPRQG